MKKRFRYLVLLLFAVPMFAQTILTATVPALAGASHSAATGAGYVVGSIDSAGALRVVVQASPHYLLRIYPSAGSGYSALKLFTDRLQVEDERQLEVQDVKEKLRARLSVHSRYGLHTCQVT
jgi:hypothetical protein